MVERLREVASNNFATLPCKWLGTSHEENCINSERMSNEIRLGQMF